MKSIPGKLKFLILIIVLGVVLAFVTVTRWDLKRRAQLVADEEGAVEHASLTIRSMLDGTYDLNDSAISERVVDTFMARKVSLSLSDVFEIHIVESHMAGHDGALLFSTGTVFQIKIARKSQGFEIQGLLHLPDSSHWQSKIDALNSKPGYGSCLIWRIDISINQAAPS